MPKVKEFCPSRASLREPQGLTTGSNDHFNKKMERSDTIILGTLAHFSSF
jgi:hypothetical protein